MTEIDFYTKVADRLEVAARLCIKAHGLGKRVRVLTADAAMTARLDQLLWTVSATGFVPHCRLSSPLAEHTPVLIDEAQQHAGPAEVLVNLHAQQPAFFRRFDRMMEIVSTAEDDVSAGRSKWQYYKQQGYTLRVHDLS